MADIQQIHQYFLKKKGTTESFPFNETTLVFKVGGKIFGLLDLDEGKSMNLKCDPAYAIDLRETYTSIVPGYHMNKKHWNTIYLDGGVPEKLIYQLVDHSYDLVVKSLPVKAKKELGF